MPDGTEHIEYRVGALLARNAERAIFSATVWADGAHLTTPPDVVRARQALDDWATTLEARVR
jgi:hypothetical protein